MDDPLLTPKEAAHLVGLSLPAIYQAMRREVLPVELIDGIKRIRRSAVVAYREQRSGRPGRPAANPRERVSEYMFHADGSVNWEAIPEFVLLQDAARVLNVKKDALLAYVVAVVPQPARRYRQYYVRKDLLQRMAGDATVRPKTGYRLHFARVDQEKSVQDAHVYRQNGKVDAHLILEQSGTVTCSCKTERDQAGHCWHIRWVDLVRLGDPLPWNKKRPIPLPAPPLAPELPIEKAS